MTATRTTRAGRAWRRIAYALVALAAVAALERRPGESARPLALAGGAGA